MTPRRRIAVATALAATPFALAYRFAVVYRRRAGFPRAEPPRFSPADFGLPYEELTVPSAGLDLPAWFVPARRGAPGPGVVLVHGWESARDRTLPMIRFLRAAGFHCLTFDARGHGANPPESLPISGAEFGADALAAFQALLARPEVTSGAISGHSFGALGALLAASAEPQVRAVVATSTPADPNRLTRQTFRLAHLPIPDPIAYPLAWLTTRVYLRPRAHRIDAISASAALRRFRGPILLAHGDEDAVIPIAHHRRLIRVAAASRQADPGAAPVEALQVQGGQHSWLYEDPAYRGAVARFLAGALGGPLDPAEAQAIAEATRAERLPDAERPFSAVEVEPGGLRGLAGIVGPTRRDAPE